MSIDNLHPVNSVYMDVRKAVSAKTSVPVDAIFLACTHTHTGPGTRVPSAKGNARHWEKVNLADIPVIEGSNRRILEGCAKAAAEALSDLSPATMLMGRVVAGSALSVWGLCAPAKVGKVQATVRQVKVLTNKGHPDEIPLAKKYVELHLSGRVNEIPGVGMEHTANVAAAYRMLELVDSPEEVDVPVSVVTIGDSLAFGGFPGEPFTWILRGHTLQKSRIS